MLKFVELITVISTTYDIDLIYQHEIYANPFVIIKLSYNQGGNIG